MKNLLTTLLFWFITIFSFAQCPTSGTISADCTSANLTISGNTLTVDPGVTVTVTGTLTINGNATITGASTSIFNIANLAEQYGSPAGNLISGGVYNISGNVTSGGGGPFNITGADLNVTGNFDGDGASVTITNSSLSADEFDADAGTVTFNNSIIQVDTLFTNGGTTLQVENGSDVTVTRGVWNAETMIIDGSVMDIGGTLDATGGDNITVRNSGELIIRGDYAMNNGGGVQLTLETGGLVRVFGDVDSSTGGNGIDIDGSSGISVGGDFIGADPPDVTVDGGDDDTSCITGGGCCGDASACGGASTLPVSLIDFTGKVTDSGVELRWHTASELNNDFFTVEKSQDGELFNEVAKVNGNGTINDISNYSLITHSPLSEGVFYRLSQTDFDGTHVELKTIYLEADLLANEALMYPNHVIQGNPIELRNSLTFSRWSIYSLTGQVIRSGTENLITTDNLKQGVYVLKVDSSAGLRNQRFVVK